jgi:hypothetical protein
MMFGYQARITRRPNCAIERLHLEATCILWSKNAHTCFRIVILPDVISRCYFNPDWSNIENIPNIVTVGWKTFILHGHLRVVSPEASNASSPKACVLGAFA